MHSACSPVGRAYPHGGLAPELPPGLAAVEFLKYQLTKALILAWPDFSDNAEPMELYVDASQKGLGAVLRQVQNGDLRVI